jgi:hypothetical protein
MEKSTTFLAVERKETYPFYANHASLEIMRREAFPRVLFYTFFFGHFSTPSGREKNLDGHH